MITLTEQDALDWLAGCPDGITDGMLLIHGLDLEIFDTLVEAGLARAEDQRHSNPARLVVTRYRITAAGRAALKN